MGANTVSPRLQTILHWETKTSTDWQIGPARIAWDSVKIKVKSYTWDGIIPNNSTGWGVTLLKMTWECWWTASWAWARNTSWQPRPSTASWATSAREQPQRSGDVIIPPHLTLVRPHLEYFVQFWSISFKETIKIGKGTAESHQDNQIVGELGMWRKDERICFVHPREEKTQGKNNHKLPVPKR